METGIRDAIRSQELPKLIWREATLFRNISHRISVYRVCARYLHRPQAIAHRDMLALSDYDESDFLQRSDGCQVIDSRQLWHAVRR